MKPKKPTCTKYTPECEGKVSTALCALSQRPQVRCPLAGFSDEEAPPFPPKVKPKTKKTAKKPLPEVRTEPYWKIGDPKPKVPEPWEIPVPNYVLYPWVQEHPPFPEARPLLKVARIRLPRRWK